jgi:hypothetical protein
MYHDDASPYAAPGATFGTESHGSVSGSSNIGGGLAQRHRSTESATAPSPFVQSPTSYTYPAATTTNSAAYGYYAGGAAPSAYPSPSTQWGTRPSKNTAPTYQHNGAAMAFLIPSLYVMLIQDHVHDGASWSSSTPLTTFAILTVLLYCLDMSNLREGFLYTLWLSVIVVLSVWGWGLLLQLGDEDEHSGLNVLLILLQTGVYGFVLASGATFVSLQCHWIVQTMPVNTNGSTAAVTSKSMYLDKPANPLPSASSAEASAAGIGLEHMLHGVVPVVFAATCTPTIVGYLESMYGRDTAATLMPYIFLFLLVSALLAFGSSTTSFPITPSAADRSGNGSNLDSKAISSKRPDFIIRPQVAFWHTSLVLIVPVTMHVGICYKRLLSRYADSDDWYDWFLAVAIPYLCLYGLSALDNSDVFPNPYSNRALFGAGGVTLRGTLVPLGVSVLASLALQQRYLIPLCHQFSYHFLGHKSSSWLVSLYWTIATLSFVLCVWFWGRKSVVTNQPIFGEYHEDVVQLTLSLGGLALGKAFGLPWNFTPLPILAFLGLSLWLTTRMLRYLTIFLFVVHAAGVVTFTYRFAGIDHSLALPLGMNVSLIRFGMLLVTSSILIGLVAGLGVRSTGGFGAKILKNVDVTGLVLIAYTLTSMALEIALLKRPVPSSELMGVDDKDLEEEDEMLYDHTWAYMTSFVVICITVFMKKVRILSARTSGIVLALAMGKAVSIFIDDGEEEDPADGSSLTAVFIRALCAAVLCIVMFAPRIFLQPIYLKSAIRSRGLFNGRGGSELPTRALQTIVLYAFVFLPIALVIAIPYVLFPLASALAGEYGGDSFYSSTPPVSELIGSTVALWGLACLSTLNFYLPDGGGEMWKKLSALAFLMGVGIFFTAPTFGAGNKDVMMNPYASISSVGSQMVLRSKSRTGGWGLLSAALATLLSIAGPLELKERRNKSGRKDKYLLFRTMSFSLLFGGGVSWFIILQSMSETEWLYLFLTSIACMTIAFLGTVASVLGYHIELENFEDVDQIFQIWILALPALIPVTGAPHFFKSQGSHPFGSGGWLATYMSIASITLLVFALSLRSRLLKNQSTRSVANLSSIFSWLCAVTVIYGRYGVSGMDANYDVITFAGVPFPILGTIIVSPILLALEGESASSESRSRVQRLTTAGPRTQSSMGLKFSSLNESNRFAPLLTAINVVFIAASLYAVLLRGSGLFNMFGASVAKSHEGVFYKVFGDADKDNEDLAVLAQKTISHSKALATSAKLAGSGFWTAGGFFGPMMHLGGIGATAPSFALQIAHWFKYRNVSASISTLVLPLNAVPLILCRGIPALQAVALINIVTGIFQAASIRKADRLSQMQI